MRVVRLGLPAIVGSLLLLFGFQTIAPGMQSGDPGALATDVQIGVLPVATGIVFLLAAVATARRTRLGYWLGLMVGVLMALAGLGAIVAEIPYLERGGLSASLGGGVIVLAIVWTVVWLAYSWRFSKAKADFAPAWTPADKRLAVVVSVVIVVAAATFLGMAALQTNAAATAIENDAQARAAVEATTVEVRVLNVGVTPASADGPAFVDHLTIELVLNNPQAYRIAVPPTLCLTSHAVFNDPGYKVGMLCWGMPGPEDSLRFSFSGGVIPQDTTAVTLNLRGAGSPCPMSPGAWNAELMLEPGLATSAGGTGPAGGRYSIDATFLVVDDSVLPPPSGAPAVSDGCVGVSP